MDREWGEEGREREKAGDRTFCRGSSRFKGPRQRAGEARAAERKEDVAGDTEEPGSLRR